MENLNDDEDANRTSENIKENIQTSAKESLGPQELKQNKPWFDEECLGFFDQKKRAKMQWIQDPSQSNVDNTGQHTKCIRNQNSHSSSIQRAETKYGFRIQFLTLVVMIHEMWLNA